MTASGIAAAVNELGAGEMARADLAGDDQAELFAEIAAEESAAFSETRPWSGKGRKPGSRNRTTRVVVEYIQKCGRDPLIALASVVSMTPEEVRRHFAFKSGDEAAKFWKSCAAELAPYLHSKQPQAVVMETGAGFAPIFLNFGGVIQPANDPRTIDGKANELTQQFQSLDPDSQEQVAWLQGRMVGASD